MKRLVKVSTAFLVMVILLMLFALAFLMILRPAYRSFQLSCRPDTIDIPEENIGYVKIGGGGSSESDFFAETSGINMSKVEVKLPEGYTDETVRHEICHLNQFINRGYRINCRQPLRLYLMEVECYTTQHLPDKWFYEFYEPYRLIN